MIGEQEMPRPLMDGLGIVDYDVEAMIMFIDR
jgi:hypothetical protein